MRLNRTDTPSPVGPEFRPRATRDADWFKSLRDLTGFYAERRVQCDGQEDSAWVAIDFRRLRAWDSELAARLGLRSIKDLRIALEEHSTVDDTAWTTLKCDGTRDDDVLRVSPAALLMVLSGAPIALSLQTAVRSDGYYAVSARNDLSVLERRLCSASGQPVECRRLFKAGLMHPDVEHFAQMVS